MTTSHIWPAREVPLGGLRAMTVSRTLPQRGLPTVGAWCFLDRFGPQSTTMRVDPHPHTGLQTVTWPLQGEVRHRDSMGNDIVLRPGELNLMTSGSGVAHSEYSVGDGPVVLDALQLWIALPESRRHGERDFAQHRDLPTLVLAADDGAEGSAVVVIGTLGGVTSPAHTYTPLVGAQLTVPAGSRVTVPLDPAWEHALVLLDGDVTIAGDEGALPSPEDGALLHLGESRRHLQLTSTQGARLFLLGGEPLDEELVMWWNFVGRSHDEIVQYREAWEAQSEQFGHVPGHGEVRIPAPPLPTVRLTPRRRERPSL